eukprot:jgi/Chrpa1/15214/Chrysochromulina_OHIO_Genome00015859-RA
MNDLASWRRVRVRGREGVEVEWSRKAARRAGRLNDWLNDLDPSEDTVYPMNETTATVLRTLGAMCDDDEWSASCLDGSSLTQIAALVEGAGNLIAEQALEYAQTAFARRLDGKRANELRELLGAVDDFESDEERVEAIAEPAFTPDGPVPQSTAAGPPALPVNADAAEAALAEVDVGTLIELKGVNRAWRALGRRALCSRLCRREGHADPQRIDEITELNLQLLIEAGRPWEAVRAGRLLLHLERLTGYGFVVDVAAVRLVNLDEDGGEVEEEEEEAEEEVEEEFDLPLLRGLAKLALSCCVTGEGEPPLALLLGAIACAGSGEIRDIPLQELRADALSSLDVGERMIGSEGAMLIASIIPVSAVLTVLLLGDNEIGVDGAIAIAEALKVNAVLTTLSLGFNCIGDEGAIAIAGALKVNAIVTTLDLADNSIGDEGAIAIAEALKVASVVTTLNLSANSIGPDGANAIAEALKMNTALIELSLSKNKIGDEGAIAIAEALNITAVVTTLKMSANKIGDEGAKAIAEALKVTRVVTILSLGYNNIGDEGAIAIAQALKVNTVLTSLNFYGNKIGLKVDRFGVEWL